MKRSFFLLLYYAFARHLPSSQTPLVGKFSKWIRYRCCRNIFAHTGKHVNIERGAYFGKGNHLSIGDYSGLGKNCRVPGNLDLGSHVMMGPDVVIYNMNHCFENTTVPMMFQGVSKGAKTVIGNDVWIGGRVLIMPGKNVGSHAIVGAGSVVARHVPEWAVVGGNPAKVIKYRNEDVQLRNHQNHLKIITI